ncbi:MAG: hypothetical protein ACRECC_11510 [Pseudolabrys sp.]
MKLSIIIAGVLIAAGTLSTGAADYSVRRAAPAGQAGHVIELPFPRSWRAQSVWASDACWTECSSYCAWGIASCITTDSQGRCLKHGNTCDRYCQRECRPYGGPLPFLSAISDF